MENKSCQAQDAQQFVIQAKKAAESLCLNVVVVFTYFFLNNLRFCWNNNKMCFYNRAILVCVTHIIHSQKNGITSLYSTFSGLTGTV